MSRLLTPMTLRWLTAMWASACLFAQANPPAKSAASLGMCDERHTTSLVQGNPQQHPAQAYWLHGQRLQWPDMAAPGNGERFTLLASSASTLDVQVGRPARGGEHRWALTPIPTSATDAAQRQFAHIRPGLVLQMPALPASKLRHLHTLQTLLVKEDAQGHVMAVTRLQHAGALDALFAGKAQTHRLGPAFHGHDSRLSLWAPTARQVHVCLYPGPDSPASQFRQMQREDASGIWSLGQIDARHSPYYRFVVTVHVPGVGLVRNLVTDPYAVSLSANSQRSQLLDLNDPALQPTAWKSDVAPSTVRQATDMVIYELHVRDFSISDESVPNPARGKYLAFTHPHTRGMQHLRELARAGLTDVHLLPAFDFTSVPETGCITPPRLDVPAGEHQAADKTVAAQDCFNWGYDPFHFNAPEGSYASDANDGRRRIIEFRQMVQALHQAGLRVGMDMVYNHTAASGQHALSVLDRIVPGYYHRLNDRGEVERSTCCDNTATEHVMMEKLMSDSVLSWAHHYKIDSFRFDLMGHQPRSAMVRMRQRIEQNLQRRIDFLGEGWNFGEVAHGARFVQASQLSLNGTGIGTFNDRLRDAVRGGSASDDPARIQADQGYISGLVLQPNAMAKPQQTAQDLMKVADQIRAGLAGSVRTYAMTTHTGDRRNLQDMAYGDQPLGYVQAPSEVVNYTENHDNMTLWDSLAFKLPRQTSAAERARVQVLGAALVAFSQGVAYFHAGQDILRSKSLDRNSYDSGDGFNRLDWTYQTNHLGTNLPPPSDNAPLYPLMRDLLQDTSLRPSPADIAFARDAFRDLLRIRASSTLLRMPTAADIHQRLRFFNTGPMQNPAVIAVHLNGQGLPGAQFEEMVLLINVDTQSHAVSDASLRDKPFHLHPVHLAPAAADPRPAQWARHDPATGRFEVPARTALAYVLNTHASGQTSSTPNQ